MRLFLDESFNEEYPKKISTIHSEEYYINMMVAWYFATALAKQYNSIIPYLEQNKLDVWIHNKTIQKAIESNRITPEIKIYLRTLKIKAQKEKEAKEAKKAKKAKKDSKSKEDKKDDNNKDKSSKVEKNQKSDETAKKAVNTKSNKSKKTTKADKTTKTEKAKSAKSAKKK